MSRPWIFVCPASRGIGHGLTRRLLKQSNLPILATARSDPSRVKSELLQGLGDDHHDRLHVVRVDVTDEASIEAAAARATDLFPPANNHLHLAFALPGILQPEKSLRQIDAEQALMTYRVNTLGPLLLMKWFADFLPRRRTEPSLDSTGSMQLPAHAVWLTMSARVGSTADNQSGGWYSYRSSKAGVNSITKSLDLMLRARAGERAMAMAYHPGTVKTDFTEEFWASAAKKQLLDLDEATAMMVDVVTSKVGLGGRGRCWDYNGDEVMP